MASEIMAKINEAEQKCDEKIALAKAEASRIIEKAEQSAVEYRQKKTEDAKLKSREIIEQAKEQAAWTVKKAEDDNKGLVEQMRKSAQGNSARAITAVAKKLAELD